MIIKVTMRRMSAATLNLRNLHTNDKFIIVTVAYELSPMSGQK